MIAKKISKAILNADDNNKKQVIIKSKHSLFRMKPKRLYLLKPNY